MVKSNVNCWYKEVIDNELRWEMSDEKIIKVGIVDFISVIYKIRIG